MITRRPRQASSGAFIAAAALACAQCSGSPAKPTDPPPPPANSPPVISSIVTSASALEIDQFVELTATVVDSETAIDGLQFAWSSLAGGTFNGSGSRVTWRPPANLVTPADPVLMLTVTERYPARNAQGQSITSEHRVTGTATVRVHNSPSEVASLARQFLEDFSKQVRPPETVVRNFRAGCGASGRGRDAELFEVARNQAQRQITSWTVGTPRVTINYGGTCPFRLRRADACAQVPVDWWDTQLIAVDGFAAGTRWHSYGTDQVTAEYHENRWWLCDSDFDGNSDRVGGPTFLRRPGSFFKP